MNTENLSIGFIGAGRVGLTLGRCFYEKKLPVSGYFSKTYESACEAADFTNSKPFGNMKQLAENSNVIFITVPDSCIYNVYKQLREYDLTDKILCHCSGALSAAVFENIEASGACGYSVHPALAVSDKKNSYKQLGNAFFTVEGSEEKMDVITGMLERLGNPYQIIHAEHKYKYHASLAAASNLVIALYRISQGLLEECGFSFSDAEKVLNPLFLNNADNVCKNGCLNALTGPVDRNDLQTVEEHLSVLSGNNKLIYKLLSQQLVETAKQKYPDRDYSDLENLLGS